MNVNKMISCILCLVSITLTGCQRELTAGTLFAVHSQPKSIADDLVKKTFAPDAPTMTLEKTRDLYLLGVVDSDHQRGVDRVKRAVKTMQDAIEKENPNVHLIILEDGTISR